MLQLAFGTRIKLFYRPAALRDDPSAGRAGLTWTAARNAEGKQVLRVGKSNGLLRITRQRVGQSRHHRYRLPAPDGPAIRQCRTSAGRGPRCLTAKRHGNRLFLINDFGATVGDVAHSPVTPAGKAGRFP